jgi:GT2 family glycosyltransferase
MKPMHQLDIPNTLPHAPGIQPAFRDHFSGWHLGMGLPQSLAGLLHGLTQLGEKIPGCRDSAMGMALWGFQAHPLAENLAGWAIKYMERGLRVPPQLGKLAGRIASTPPLDDTDAEAMDTWYALARQDDHALILRFLAVVLTSPKAISWLGHCWQDMLFLNIPEIPKAALDMMVWDETTMPLKSRMEADWAFQTRPTEDALAQVEALNPDIWGLWRTYAAGELLLRLGKQSDAKGALAGLWKAIPWHVNLTLKLYDLFNPTPSATEADTDCVAILAYSWNKADLLKDTLDSLAESDIGKAKIFTLNNGSTDHTAQVLSQAQARFGADRFHIETLPVNVGAPAARNWLLALPEVRNSKWAAFLDDDVVLPKSWLLKLLGAAKGKQNVGAVGCRITAATHPYGLQSADYNLFPVPPAAPEPGKLPNRVLIYDNCAGSTDSGLFSYTRPCLSVSGCCHMISLAAVEKAGIFDLRYTPSQFDDLDRDLRSGLAGMPAVYAGDLAIRHVQHSSLAKSQNTKQIGHVMGNKFKLDTKYTDDELIRLGKENKNRLWTDLQEKHDFLVDRLDSGT